MPLNMQEQNESQPSNEDTTPRPILHEPEQKEGHSRKALIILFALVVVTAIVYLLFKFNILSGKQDSTDASVVNLSQADTAGPPPLYDPSEKATVPAETSQPVQEPTGTVVQAPPPSAEKKIETPVVSEPKPETIKNPVKVPAGSSGDITIFTGTFRSKTNADREVRRLTKAGFNPVLKVVNGLSSVSIGSFRTKKEAESFVNANRELFPNGYHIGRVK